MSTEPHPYSTITATITVPNQYQENVTSAVAVMISSLAKSIPEMGVVVEPPVPTLEIARP